MRVRERFLYLSYEMNKQWTEWHTPEGYCHTIVLHRKYPVFFLQIFILVHSKHICFTDEILYNIVKYDTSTQNYNKGWDIVQT